jgi:ABC-2 type transport system ATP-binding protein
VGVDAPAGRRLLGLCPQENVVYPELTARENLVYAASLFGVPRGERRARADALLERLGLAEKADERASALSGGMKRRLTLALALVHDPPVVVLDEPEAGLDPQTRVAVREFVRSLAPRKTVILTSHNMDEVERLADRVAILDHGRLVEEGAPAQLKAKLGDADALEIKLERGGPEVAEALRAFGEVSHQQDRLVLRGRDLARRLAGVLEQVTKAGGSVEDVRYRGATLEDVFIALTGRGLRE